MKAAATDTYKAATKKITITVAPKKQRIALNNKKAAQLTVKWNKNKKVSGYEFVYANNKSFKKAKTVRKANATSYTVKKLKSGKTYYVKARAYKTVSGKRIYGAFSAVKKATIK